MIRNARVALAVFVMLSLPLAAAESIDPDVLALREAAWRAWFAGDEAALRSMLPDDFLSIGEVTRALFHALASFDHDVDAREEIDVLEDIAAHGDDVRVFAGRHSADVVRHFHR